MSGKGQKKAADGGGRKDVLKHDIRCERREKKVERAVVHSQGNVDKTKKKVDVISPQHKKDAAAGHKKPDHKSDKKEVREPGKTKMNPATIGDKKEKKGPGDTKDGNKIVPRKNPGDGVGMTRQWSSTNTTVTEVVRINHTNLSGIRGTQNYETHTTTTELFTSHSVHYQTSRHLCAFTPTPFKNGNGK